MTGVKSYCELALDEWRAGAVHGVIRCRKCGHRQEAWVLRWGTEPEKWDRSCMKCGKWAAKFIEDRKSTVAGNVPQNS